MPIRSSVCLKFVVHSNILPVCFFLRSVAECCHVGTIHVKKFAIVVLVEHAQELEREVAPAAK